MSDDKMDELLQVLTDMENLLAARLEENKLDRADLAKLRKLSAKTLSVEMREAVAIVDALLNTETGLVL
jgi:hypothetical protein